MPLSGSQHGELGGAGTLIGPPTGVPVRSPTSLYSRNRLSRLNSSARRTPISRVTTSCSVITLLCDAAYQSCSMGGLNLSFVSFNCSIAGMISDWYRFIILASSAGLNRRSISSVASARKSNVRSAI